jgi:hypothetical protein
MADADKGARRNGEYDERVSIPLDPKTTLKALLATPPPEAKPSKRKKKKPAKSK